MSSPFGVPDPRIALPAPPFLAPKTGPLHQVEFVIEIVGPRTMNAAAVAPLAQPAWSQALGQPNIWVMAPMHTTWQPLPASITGSFDSLALTWPVLRASGTLSTASAQQLLDTAERFAVTVERRALPMPPPADIPSTVQALTEIAENLDVGVSVNVFFSGPVSEDSLWRAAVALGLTLDTCGEFIWGEPGQITLVALDEPQVFSLAGVQAGRTHSGVTIGFSAPQVVSPSTSLAAALKVADELVGRFGGQMTDEDGNPMSATARAKYADSVRLLEASFQSASLTPGSTEAYRLFSG